MSHRKLQKEIEAVFKKIHEGIDLFNYYYSRHESSNNDTQREKLEGDLKKEIKKLQKFREQIKSWQSNESIEALVSASRLQEHRRLVEESMEIYKEVEKNSKMKSFSNQSIMLAALENDESDEQDQELSADVLDSIDFLEDCINQLHHQVSELDEEYEKLSEKKLKKNNYHIIEERKQEIENFNQKNNFHIKKMSKIIELLKLNKINPDLVWMIQDDINFYIESNQEPDFVDDDTLYDELFREALSNSQGAEYEDDDEHNNGNSINSTPIKNKIPNNYTSPTKADNSTTPQLNSIPAPITPELSSPAIIKTLKPANTPSKPVGSLKWAAAAVGVSGNGDKLNGDTQLNGNQKLIEEPAITHQASSTDLNYKFIEVLKNSSISKTELELFSDLNLVKLPPGIQDLIISFASTRKSCQGSQLLVHSNKYNQYITPIQKPYLPQFIQPLYSQQHHVKPPLQLFKLQSYWNRIRANDQFDQFVNEIQVLQTQNNPENLSLINELTFVLFYGFYYGLTPLENLIAESCLFKLGWKPYGSKTDITIQNPSNHNQNQSPGKISPFSKNHSESKLFLYWFKCVKLLPTPPQIDNADNDSPIEFGDYQVFDLTIWEIYVKHGFTFDHSLCQLEPSKSIC